MSEPSNHDIAESCKPGIVQRGIVRRGISIVTETLQGEGPPDPALGVELNFYVNTTTGAIYRREAGAWRQLAGHDAA